MFKIKKIKELKELTILIKKIIEIFNSEQIIKKNDKNEIEKIIKSYEKLLKLNNKIIFNNTLFFLNINKKNNITNKKINNDKKLIVDQYKKNN